MLAALTLPSLLYHLRDRTVMLMAASLLVSVGIVAGLVSSYLAMLVVWFIAGIGYASALVPSGRLLKRSAHSEDRPSVFAAQFALSHACWLISYPLAGWLGNSVGLSPTAFLLGTVSLVAAAGAAIVWPQAETNDLEHRHDDLPPDHPHLKEGHDQDGRTHSHAVVIDDLHSHWPGRQG